MNELQAIALLASRHPLAAGGVAVAWMGAHGVCVAYADDATVTGNAEAAAARQRSRGARHGTRRGWGARKRTG